MSASLVGSEMCIRDSSYMGFAGSSPVVGLGAPRARERATLTLPVGEPVSYTHLTLPTICSV
eukprot:5734668-Alexandrium_andersonii.AAC.1